MVRGETICRQSVGVGGLRMSHEVARTLRGVQPQQTLLGSCRNGNEIMRQRCARGRRGCAWTRVDDEDDVEARLWMHW